MSIKVGLVGLPNVGKTSFFNSLTGSSAKAENFPFCTIDPNKSYFHTNDTRILKLCEVDNPKNVVYPIIEVYDIAGLIKGASNNEGLGNQFLSHIKEVDIIINVIRFFENNKITHVNNVINPVDDLETINIELRLKDLETINNRKNKISKQSKSGNETLKKEIDILTKFEEALNKNIDIRDITADNCSEDELNILKELQLLSQKPVIYIGNISENQVDLNNTNKPIIDEKINTFLKETNISKNDIIFIPVEIGTLINELTEEEKKENVNYVNLWNEMLNILSNTIFKKLNIITFYTSGEDEVRGWNVKDGVTAKTAAGVIHSDFEKHFIKVEVCKFEEYYSAKKNNINPHFTTFGKDYIIQDGDVVYFKVNA